MKREKLEKLVLTAMFCAIVIAMTFIPFVGYITIPGSLSITTLHVVVILGAVVLGPARGTVLGLVWGATCLAYAFLNATADAMIFMDPRISVLPRILVGLAVGWYYRWFHALFSKIGRKKETTGETGKVRKGPEIAAATVAAALGTFTNTALVLTAVNIFGGSGVVKLGMVLMTIINTAFALNGVIELILAVVVVPAVAVPLFQMMRRHSATNAR